MTLYESYTTGVDDWQTHYGVHWRGQSFTVGTTGADENFDLTTIEQQIFRIGSPGTVNINLKAVDGSGHPTGVSLSAGSYDGDGLTTDTAGEWKVVTMSAFECQASTKYAIECQAHAGDGSNAIKWKTDGSAAAYAGGIALISSNSGTDWADIANTDFMFKVNGTSVAPPATGQALNMKRYW